MTNITIESSKRVGILGDGQLAKLIIQRLQNYVTNIHVYSQTGNGPACSMVNDITIGIMGECKELNEFFTKCDFVLLESEFYSYELLNDLSQKCKTGVYPNLNDYKQLSTKEDQKNLFSSIDIPFASTVKIYKLDDVQKIDKYPVILKMSSGGYDGYGNFEAANIDQARDFVERSLKNCSCVLSETKLNIKSEFASLLLKSKKESLILEAIDTIQEDHICHYTRFPSVLGSEIKSKVQDYMERISSKLSGPGIYAFEFFLLEDGNVYINEAAPRVHNSYHLLSDTHNLDQFELFVRASLGLSLGELKQKSPFGVMLNLLGTTEGENVPLVLPEISDNLNFQVYLYGKTQCRPGRKMGHINFTSNTDPLEDVKTIKRNYTL